MRATECNRSEGRRQQIVAFFIKLGRAGSEPWAPEMEAVTSYLLLPLKPHLVCCQIGIFSEDDNNPPMPLRKSKDLAHITRIRWGKNGRSWKTGLKRMKEIYFSPIWMWQLSIRLSSFCWIVSLKGVCLCLGLSNNAARHLSFKVCPLLTERLMMRSNATISPQARREFYLVRSLEARWLMV